MRSPIEPPCCVQEYERMRVLDSFIVECGIVPNALIVTENDSQDMTCTEEIGMVANTVGSIKAQHQHAVVYHGR